MCFSQSGTVVTMLGGHRVRVANTGNCIANRGADHCCLHPALWFLSLSPDADCTYACASCKQRIAHFYAGLGPTCTFLTNTPGRQLALMQLDLCSNRIRTAFYIAPVSAIREP